MAQVRFYFISISQAAADFFGCGFFSSAQTEENWQYLAVFSDPNKFKMVTEGKSSHKFEKKRKNRLSNPEHLLYSTTHATRKRNVPSDNKTGRMAMS
jgi:hypothetical protein